MPPAMPKTPERNDVNTMVAPTRATTEGVIAERLCRSRQRPVDHLDRIVEAIQRHEGAKSRALLLAEQHLIKHVEPMERNAWLSIFALDLPAFVQERLASAHFLNHLLNLFGSGLRGGLVRRLPQV